jgi:AcrR family transcriptional regulator
LTIESTRRGRPAKTTQDDVVEAALRIADADGVGAVSMRRLADELSLSVPTLYNYVEGKDELIELLRARALASFDVDPNSQAPWQEQIRDAMLSVYRTFREHPSGIELLFTAQPVLEAAVERILDDLSATLKAAGFPFERAIDTVHTLAVYVAGVVNHEIVQARRAEALELRIADGIPAGAAAHIDKSLLWTRSIPEDVLRVSLDQLIHGMAAQFGRDDTPRAEPDQPI